jgi:alkanesulfonate monooxygenase SsuD/methylene tetrahydromethanopterin reductase-like flavin-dependent oxidoreductase (luciferase family)
VLDLLGSRQGWRDEGSLRTLGRDRRTQPELLSTVAIQSEKRGFDGLWFSDVPTLPAGDPLLAVAFMAAATTV